MKDLFKGFISSLMVLSFILMPIPVSQRAWASDDTTTEESTNADCKEDAAINDQGVYEAGCDLDDALVQSKMDRKYGNEAGWVAYLEQAVLGMMAIVLLDNLFLKYLYANDPTIYGNDCAKNDAAQYSIRAAQIAALAYIIGDVQANIEYQKLSQEAVDLEFSAKDKTFLPDENSAEVLEYREKVANGEDAGVDPRIQALKENNAQVDAYDSLIKILEAQEDAIETKRNLTISAEIGLAGAEAIEWLNIRECKEECKNSVNEIEKTLEKDAQSVLSLNDDARSYIGDIDSIYYSGITQSSVTYPQSCKQLEKYLEQEKKQHEKNYKSYQKAGVVNNQEVDQKDKKKIKKFFGIFNKLADTFNMKKISGDTSEDIDSNDFIDEQNQDLQSEAQERNEYNQNTQQIGQNTTQNFSTISDQISQCDNDLDNNKTTIANEQTDKQNDIDIKENEIDANEQARDSCAGTPPEVAACKASYQALIGIGELEKTKLEGEKKLLDTEKSNMVDSGYDYWSDFALETIDFYYADSFEYLYSRSSCCGFAGISTTEAQAVQALLPSATNASLDDTSTKIQEINQEMNGFIQTYSPGETVSSDTEYDGSFVYQGITKESEMSKRKDITSFNPLKKKETSVLPKLRTDGFNLEFILPKVVENILYKEGLKRTVNWETNNPLLIASQIKQLDKEIKVVSQKIKEKIQTELYPPGPINNNDGLKLDKFMASLRVIFNNISFAPKAHALDINGAGGAIGGMALGMLANELGGPWAEVLNVGANYLKLKGILGMLGVTELFLKPKSRALTWAALMALAGSTIIFDAKALEDVRKNIEVLKLERQRFKNSAVARTNVNNDRNNRDGDSKLDLQEYDPQSTKKTSMNVKACVVAKGKAVAPAVCPSVIPKQRVSLPEISRRLSNHLSPDHLKGVSLMTDTLHGVSNGSDMGAKSMNSSNLDQLEKTKNALKQLNRNLRHDYDEDEKRKDKKFGRKSDPVTRTLANFRKSFGISKDGSKLNPVASLPDNAYKSFAANKPSSFKSKKSAAISPRSKKSSKKKGSSNADFDLDFDSSVSANKIKKLKKLKPLKKHSKKLRDYQVGMNDINKRKELPIWKILSNRYILSYPKLLDEDIMTMGEGKNKTNKESKK